MYMYSISTVHNNVSLKYPFIVKTIHMNKHGYGTRTIVLYVHIHDFIYCAVY